MFSKSDHLLRIINEPDVRRPDATTSTPRILSSSSSSSSSVVSSGTASPVNYSLLTSYTSSSSSSSSSSTSPQSIEYAHLNRYKIADHRRKHRRKLNASSASGGSSGGGGPGDICFNFSLKHSLNSIRRVCLFIILIFLFVQFFNYIFYVSNRTSIFTSLSYFRDTYEYKYVTNDLNASAVVTYYENPRLVSGNDSELNASWTNLRPVRGPYRKLVDLVNETADHIVSKRDLVRAENNAVFEQTLKEMRRSLSEVYRQMEVPVEYCSNDEMVTEGFIDSKKILEHVNLTGLVTFYADAFANAKVDPEAQKKAWSRASEGLERLKKSLVKGRGGKILKKSDFEKLQMLTTTSTTTTTASTTTTKIDLTGIMDELFLLKTTRNFSLLNVSSHVLGHDGARIQPGGFWRPRSCKSNFKLGVIVPYRDRLPHLKVLLHYLHLVLQRQLIEYRIFVVEPTTPLDVPFNKGRIMNSAYLEALKLNPDIDCFVFHDVDLVPEDDRNLYTCSSMPRHMSVAIDKFNYILPYAYLVGGVFNIRTDQYRRINGYSNMYWGW